LSCARRCLDASRKGADAAEIDPRRAWLARFGLQAVGVEEINSFNER
jgi:hypothetical protein